jgi:hypothetical protein
MQFCYADQRYLGNVFQLGPAMNDDTVVSNPSSVSDIYIHTPITYNTSTCLRRTLRIQSSSTHPRMAMGSSFMLRSG